MIAAISSGNQPPCAILIRFAPKNNTSTTRNPPLTISVTEALTQAAMHSQWHRGQNATRLRELGGLPPTTDLIVWYWKGKPQPNW